MTYTFSWCTDSNQEGGLTACLVSFVAVYFRTFHGRIQLQNQQCNEHLFALFPYVAYRHRLSCFPWILQCVNIIFLIKMGNKSVRIQICIQYVPCLGYYDLIWLLYLHTLSWGVHTRSRCSHTTVNWPRRNGHNLTLDLILMASLVIHTWYYGLDNMFYKSLTFYKVSQWSTQQYTCKLILI